MKHILRLLAFIAGFLAFTLLSCTRSVEPNRTEVPEVSKIEFQLDNLKQYFNVNASGQTVGNTRMYSFVCTKDPVANNYFNLVFTTDSLRPGTYAVGNTGMVLFRENDVILSGPTNFTVTITSNDNGLINGTFSGNLTAGTGAYSCTQGKIENIQLIYR